MPPNKKNEQFIIVNEGNKRKTHMQLKLTINRVTLREVHDLEILLQISCISGSFSFCISRHIQNYQNRDKTLIIVLGFLSVVFTSGLLLCRKQKMIKMGLKGTMQVSKREEVKDYMNQISKHTWTA